MRATLWLGVCVLLGACTSAGAGSLGDIQPTGGINGKVKSGTGFFVSPENVLITSAHIVTDCNKISVFPVDGVERQGHMLAIDTALDIAIVSASGPYLGHHLVELDTHARSGDQLYALGYGISPTNPYHPTYLTGTLKGENTLDNGNRVLVVQAPIPAGTSGAALVDPQARLVGAIIGHYATAPNLGVVIPAQSIRAFAMQYGFMMAPVRPGDRPATARDDVLLNVSALVQCNAR